jgi:nucleoside-diphosphate-sugar epimerase
MHLLDTYKNKKILITGGLGFIGSNLAHRLIGLGANVTIIDALIPAYGGNMYNLKDIQDNLEISFQDVRDVAGMNELIKNKDYLFNLAGTSSHIDSMSDPYTDLDINCRAQLTILEACRKNNQDVKIIFLGTRGQYGRAQYLPVDEKHPLNPIDVNGINNVSGEMYHLLYYKIYGIRTVSLRLTNTYGPRHQMKHPKQGFLNWFIRLAIDDEIIKIYGDGKQLRDFNYVDDVIDAILVAGLDERANGEVFNLGSENPISVIDVTKKIIEITKKGEIEFIPFPKDKKKIEVGDYYADYSKIKNLLGWQPKINLDEGLRKTVDFYLKHKSFYWS